VTLTVAQHLEGRSPLARSTYETVVATLGRHGEFREHAQKGGIGFISRMTFAGVSLRERWVYLYFLLPTPLDHERVTKLDLYGPTSWAHTLRLTSPEDVDDEVDAWLGEALRRGDQETLDPGAVVEPLTPSQLEIFWTGFRGRYLSAEEALRIPDHVGDALALAEEMKVRVRRVAWMTRPHGRHGAWMVGADRSLGLGDGDHADVFITGARR
jgi:hypothetical protein